MLKNQEQCLGGRGFSMTQPWTGEIDTVLKHQPNIVAITTLNPRAGVDMIFPNDPFLFSVKSFAF
jgi:hypothetical protein